MAELYFEIANLRVCVVNPPEDLGKDEYWHKFRVSAIPMQREENCIRLEFWNNVQNSYALEIHSLPEGLFSCLRFEREVMLANTDMSIAYLLSLERWQNFYTLADFMFYSLAVRRQMIQLHSSLVAYKGKGLLFVGPSGIGKTTQAELWAQHRRAQIVNGDMNFIQVCGNKKEVVGWGTPWHGSSPYCENTKVKIQAMILLKQEKTNILREMKGFERVECVAKNVIYPTWLSDGLELCIQTLDCILREVSVYELSCRPDEEAVRLVEEAVFSTGE